MKVIIYSKNQCHYCDMAKALLSTKSIDYEERNLNNGWTREQLLADIPTAKSVPQIIIDGTHVGGFTELQKFLTK